MIYVVDTSVIVQWFVVETDHERAAQLLHPSLHLAAPDFAIAEVANALWRKQRKGDIDGEQMDKALRELPRFFQHLALVAPLAPSAVEIAREIGHSVYDCIFLAQAADATGGMLITADAQFLAKTAGSRYEALVQPLNTFNPPAGR